MHPLSKSWTVTTATPPQPRYGGNHGLKERAQQCRFTDLPAPCALETALSPHRTEYATTLLSGPSAIRGVKVARIANEAMLMLVGGGRRRNRSHSPTRGASNLRWSTLRVHERRRRPTLARRLLVRLRSEHHPSTSLRRLPASRSSRVWSTCCSRLPAQTRRRSVVVPLRAIAAKAGSTPRTAAVSSCAVTPAPK